ncbi:MAG: HAD family hydrolase [Chitinophagaceae bacterium]|nr:MAG: HAD family hydrolase [Chitinophagaceae bacterium]
MLDLKEIDKSWTLFLDRDGVINKEKYEDYVYNYDEFIFYEGVPEALKIASGRFGRLVVATNQRGVGRGLMTESDLDLIHQQMLEEVSLAGGNIQKVYYCISLDNASPCRKPNPGMAIAAKNDFPDIDFNKSIMVGNNISDMEFGRNAGMHTVFLTTTHPQHAKPTPSIDLVFDSLYNFAKALQ